MMRVKRIRFRPLHTEAEDSQREALHYAICAAWGDVEVDYDQRTDQEVWEILWPEDERHAL